MTPHPASGTNPPRNASQTRWFARVRDTLRGFEKTIKFNEINGMR